MISEGEQDVEPAKAFIPGIEITLGHRECMSQMQEPIHVGIWEGHEKFGLLVRLDRKILVAIPDGPSAGFEADELVPSDEAFGFNFVVH